MVCSDSPIAPLVRGAIAKEFPGLWSVAHDEVERLCLDISAKQFWPEGWSAVRQTLNVLREQFTPEIEERLSSLETHLRPASLAQRVRAITLCDSLTEIDLGDPEYKPVDSEARRSVGGAEAIRKNQTIAQNLGKILAKDEAAFDELSRELVSRTGRLLPALGRGLAEGTSDPRSIWNKLVNRLAITNQCDRNVQVLGGFLNVICARDQQLSDDLLDDAVLSQELAEWYPFLQSVVGLDRSGVDRIKRSLALGMTPASRYDVLAWSTIPDQVPGLDLKQIMLALAAKPDGFGAALEILAMRLYSDKQSKKPHAPDILDAGSQLLRNLEIKKNSQHEDHRLETIAKACLSGEQGAAITREIFQKVKYSVSEQKTHFFNHRHLLQALATNQPIALLDSVYRDAAGLPSGGGAEFHHRVRPHFVDYMYSYDQSLFEFIPEDGLLDWCEQEPRVRYPMAATVIPLFLVQGSTPTRVWTNVALLLLKNAPDRLAVLKKFVRRLARGAWSGSVATRLSTNLNLLAKLENYPDIAVAEFVAQEKLRLSREVEARRREETLRDKLSDERFE